MPAADLPSVENVQEWVAENKEASPHTIKYLMNLLTIRDKRIANLMNGFTSATQSLAKMESDYKDCYDYMLYWKKQAYTHEKELAKLKGVEYVPHDDEDELNWDEEETKQSTNNTVEEETTVPKEGVVVQDLTQECTKPAPERPIVDVTPESCADTTTTG
eukprot:TRINITY_DN11992_c0_g1_i1.p1 TRINITY_DN11992_c0_g1~~TRINITY_DN11992_c0_g1_i1.p1  ORF type:complete len:160 (-),score=28.82 TRINITY_DN11992_c0_g1_i1:78-557(-)